ncbi:putative N-acetylglucosamine-6-phosphate deacetylase-like protein [Dinothrombium tinctorium]|uniref:N-acetylglucosamine-6-phosphate deacetylase n=1 Tax=Dinothrombium tinctorium TaxID=1965070 RepID=A0A3S4R6M3_9ACAR|nr:putative N-acetylglucosamine-6-phosphate deacetylase-like protein [Dinothrombium tinctorium]
MIENEVYQFTNCRIIRDHRIIEDDLWLRNGRVIDPEPLFFDEKKCADKKVDCHSALIAPGFIDLQINGGLGFDFSDCSIDTEAAVTKVAKSIIGDGVTAFCPTLITQPQDSYHKILPVIKKRNGGKEFGATILGVHLEGPFISYEKRGAHPLQHVRGEKIQNIDDIYHFYGYLDDTAIITMAPELDSADIIKNLVTRNIKVSIGHSMATLSEGETAIDNGANFITHLFNAMLPFHHRDPGLVGLLTSKRVNQRVVYYGIIADGNHTHEAALKIAFRSSPDGLVLVTDALSATGLPSGSKLKIGAQNVEVRENKAYIEGTQTLCGSMATMDECVRNLKKFTGCSVVEAIECATLHPANVLGIADRKGTLNFGSDADFVILDDDLKVMATFIAGQCVFNRTQAFNSFL